MYREVDLGSITDGKLYKSSDSANISSNGCVGCHECCTTVGDTILLDPLDIFNLSKALNKSFVDMIESEIELRLVDNVIIPNIMMQGQSLSCKMLDENGRCSVHQLRPGYCRLFPLGRLYDEDGDFSYIVQVHECPYPEKQPVKISDWLGITDLEIYEQYIKDWHRFIKNIGDFLETTDDESTHKTYSWLPVRAFFEKPYDLERDFYEQFYKRLAQFMH